VDEGERYVVAKNYEHRFYAPGAVLRLLFSRDHNLLILYAVSPQLFMIIQFAEN
jgi:hypothetical protein